MNREIKSISYAFISEDVNIYMPDEDCLDHFEIEKLVCKDCGNFWHTSMMECYFCGELNYYLYQCTACGKKYSITNASVRCTCGKKDSKLIKACVNQYCMTNTDPIVKEIAIKEKGVFDLKSSFNSSLNYCVRCGSPKNIYASFKVFLFNTKDNKNLSSFVKTNQVHKNDLIIFKDKNDDDEIKYDYLIYNEKHDNFEPKFKFESMSELINDLFRVSSK